MSTFIQRYHSNLPLIYLISPRHLRRFSHITTAPEAVLSFHTRFVVVTPFTRKHCKQSNHTCTAHVPTSADYQAADKEMSVRYSLNTSVFTGSRAYLSLVRHRHGAEVIKDSRAEGLQLIASEHGRFYGFLADSH